MRPLDRTERYGLVSVVFLVATIAAVTLWDTESRNTEPKKEDSGSVAGTAHGARPAAGGRTSTAPAAGGRLAAGRGGPTLTLPRPGDPASRPPATVASGPAAGTAAGRTTPSGAGSVLRGDDSLRGVPEQRDPEERVAQAPGGRAGWEAERAQREPTPPADDQPTPPRTGRVNGGSSLVRDVPGVHRTVELGPGETLSEVALRELGSSQLWTRIAELNGISDPTKVRAGAVLRLPSRPAASGGGAPARAEALASSAAPQPSLRAGTVAYEVQEGESYWRLAERFFGKGTRWEELQALNPDVPPGKLRAGRTIAVPAQVAQAAPPTRPSGSTPAASEALVADAASARTKRGRVQ